MGLGRGRVVCEGADCARQAVGRMSWRHQGMYLESQGLGDGVLFQGWGEVGGIMLVGVGTWNTHSLICSREDGGLA